MKTNLYLGTYNQITTNERALLDSLIKQITIKDCHQIRISREIHFKLDNIYYIRLAYGRHIYSYYIPGNGKWYERMFSLRILNRRPVPLLYSTYINKEYSS